MAPAPTQPQYVPGTARAPKMASGRSTVAVSNSCWFGARNATLSLGSA